MEELKYFFSYARKDSAFVLKLAKELRAVGANLWLDQLDILGGQRWDHIVGGALKTCQGMIVVLSPESLASNNVMDEVSYAMEQEKLIVPVRLRPCEIPFRLRRVQYIDFIADYHTGFSQLLRALRIKQRSQPLEPAPPEEPVVEDITAPSEATLGEAPSIEQPPVTIEPPESAKRVAQEVAEPLVAPHQLTLPPRPRFRWYRRWTWGAIASIAVVLGVGAYWGLIVTQQPSSPFLPPTNMHRKGDVAPSPSGTAESWEQLPGLAAKDIGVGADGSVWIIGTNPVGPAQDFGIYRWTDSMWEAMDGVGSGSM